ncbi:biliverdin-producing heme oxygenase [Rhodococcus sp. HNM0569]|uniref:biliverdin-producing heme oxygenase n=1 Tax=Rhodococcus sp. HNM0569 TaxID=2716340 RepID=UPI001469CD5A|nr:biliverdin-producing heme oxygenase [Rhodococcus sp. HNM0569]NLU84962.1 biliverdin-producing heme oxygenase [Rhodococcus sp. HNM0569]
MPTLNEVQSPAGLAERIRSGTADAHRDAEESRFVEALLGGELTSEGYAELLAQSWFVYRELEEAGRAHADDPVVAPFLSDALLRVPALEADLAFVRGPQWRETAVARPAAQAYVARLREVAFDDPALFVAHHYIRYMGDLSGGQIIRRRVSDAYGYQDAGVRFYTFDEIPKTKPFKDAYRASLDAAPFDSATQDRVIDEVRLAFGLNRALFDDLAGDLDRFRA